MRRSLLLRVKVKPLTSSRLLPSLPIPLRLYTCTHMGTHKPHFD